MLVERTKKFSLKLGEDSDERSIIARFATLGVVDLDGDIIEKGALGEQNVLLGAYNHNFQSLPPGYGQTYETRTEAMFRGLFLKNSIGEETYQTLKELNEAGFDIEWSFRFFVIEGGFETRKGEEYYVIRKARVTHVAPVESGAGINTGTVEIKSCGPECQANKTNQLVGLSKMLGLSSEQAASLPAWAIKSLNSGESPQVAGTETPPQAAEPINYEKLAVAFASAMAPLLTSMKSTDNADDPSPDGSNADDKSGDASQNKGEGLGDLIRKLRDEKELTNDDLADAAGLSVASIGGILAGTNECPNVGQLQRLARRLGASLSSLVQAAENDGCTCYGGPNDDSTSSSAAVDDDASKAVAADDDASKAAVATVAATAAAAADTDAGSTGDDAGQTAAPDDATISKRVDALLSGFPGLPPDEDPGIHAFNKFNLDFLAVEEHSYA